MSYEPVTRPVFPGDDWHELRDYLYDRKADVMSRVVGRVTDMYQRAAVVMGREDDAVAQSLRADKLFDLRTMYVTHGHLAAYWRCKQGHVNPTLPGTFDFEPEYRDWNEWVMHEATLWIIDNPRLVRLFCLALVNEHRNGLVAEMDLWDELKAYYPLPPPDHPDFFDDPKSYSPYP